jgi:hypothetical protein
MMATYICSGFEEWNVHLHICCYEHKCGFVVKSIESIIENESTLCAFHNFQKLMWILISVWFMGNSFPLLIIWIVFAFWDINSKPQSIHVCYAIRHPSIHFLFAHFFQLLMGLKDLLVASENDMTVWNSSFVFHVLYRSKILVLSLYTQFQHMAIFLLTSKFPTKV